MLLITRIVTKHVFLSLNQWKWEIQNIPVIVVSKTDSFPLEKGNKYTTKTLSIFVLGYI